MPLAFVTSRALHAFQIHPMCSPPADSDDQPSKVRSFWREVRLALGGQQHDHTREPLNRSILLLSVPMVIEALMGSLFAVVDMYWLSRLGSNAIVAVGLTESVLGLIYTVAIGMSMAATATISRRIGEGDLERAAQSAAHIILLGMIASAAIGMVLGYLAVDILELMGASPPVIAVGAAYAQLMFGANATAFLLFVVNAIFRGSGDVVFAMRSLLLANAINMLLAPCLIFGWGPFPELSVTGAAIATNIARGMGLLYQFWHLTGRQSRVPLGLRHCRLQLHAVAILLRKSASGIGQMLIANTSWIALLKILTAHGDSAVAGYMIAVRIVMFALLPGLGFTGAATILVGQNLGALNADRAEASVRAATRLNVVALTAAGTISAILAEPLARLFTTDPSVLAHAVSALQIWSLVFPLYAVGMCFGAAFNGAGDTWTPAKTSFFCLWLVQIPLAWLLSDVLHQGPSGVYIAVPAATSVLSLLNYALFTRGKWKLQKI